MRKNFGGGIGPDRDGDGFNGGGFAHGASYHSIPYQVDKLYDFIVATMP